MWGNCLSSREGRVWQACWGQHHLGQACSRCLLRQVLLPLLLGKQLGARAVWLSLALCLQ